MNRDQSHVLFTVNANHRSVKFVFLLRCLKLTKLIRPRLLSVNRKLYFKKSLLSPYLQPHFPGKVMFCGPKASRKRTVFYTNSTLAA